MAEQSHRDEMSAAIRAQRERQAAPRTIAPTDEPEPPPAPDPEAEQPAIEVLEPAPIEAAEQPPIDVPEPAPTEPAAPRRRSMLDRLRGR
jgi:hypothetical protein